MRIAISGKGGTGKTTLVGSPCRLLGQNGRSVLVLDADCKPNLAFRLDFSRESANHMEAVPSTLGDWRTNANGRAYVHLTCHLDDIRAPDGVTLPAMGTVDRAGVDCRRSASAATRGTIGCLIQADAPTAIADMEARLEHFGRLILRHAVCPQRLEQDQVRLSIISFVNGSMHVQAAAGERRPANIRTPGNGRGNAQVNPRTKPPPAPQTQPCPRCGIRVGSRGQRKGEDMLDQLQKEQGDNDD